MNHFFDPNAPPEAPNDNTRATGVRRFTEPSREHPLRVEVYQPPTVQQAPAQQFAPGIYGYNPQRQAWRYFPSGLAVDRYVSNLPPPISPTGAPANVVFAVPPPRDRERGRLYALETSENN